MNEIEFKPFPSIARLSRDIVITEKLDGTNAIIHIEEDGTTLAGSRTRWITAKDDNYGFAKWVEDNREDLLTLGAGTHFGEWWGAGIQCKYNIGEKRFSLFNTGRWNDETKPKCCHVVPILYTGDFDTNAINEVMRRLQEGGSVASPGFMNPEGIVIYHKHSNALFKKTFKNDDKGKSYGS